MSRTCTVCRHDDRPAVDRALVTRRPGRHHHTLRRPRVATDILDRLLEEHYSHERDQIDAAAERASQRIERETARLTRSDGSRVYSDAEHREREAAIREAAVAEFDQAVSRYVNRAEQDAAEAERKLAMLVGADPFDSLKPEDQQRASIRQPFIKEDAERLPPHELERLARGAIARGDRAASYLYWRYLPQWEASLAGVRRELDALFTPTDRAEQRKALEEKARAAGVLQRYPASARRNLDGSIARAMREMAGVHGRF